VIALILIILYVGIVAYSAVQVVKSAPRVGSVATEFESNGTVGVSTSFTLSNPGFFEIQQFALQFRILNGTGGLLIASTIGPTNVAPSSSQSLPVSLYLPLTAEGVSLLTENQYLQWQVWGNASYGYLFSASIGVVTQKSWGAPFDNLSVTVGTPSTANGTVTAPVTVTFSNNADFLDAGSLNFQVVSASGSTCARGSFSLNVPQNSQFDQTQHVALASACDPSGGHISAQYVGSGFTLSLPRESIP
jgi:hypothetical protein